MTEYPTFTIEAVREGADILLLFDGQVIAKRRANATSKWTSLHPSYDVFGDFNDSRFGICRSAQYVQSALNKPAGQESASKPALRLVTPDFKP